MRRLIALTVGLSAMTVVACSEEGTFSIGQPASDVDATVQATVEPTETAPTTSPVPSPTVERVDPTSGMFDLSPIPTPTEPPIDQNPIGPSDGIAPEPSPTATATAVLAPLPDPTPTPDASPLVIPTPTPDASPLVIPTPRTAPTVTPSPPQFAIISAYTGFHLDSSGDVIVRRTNRRNSIELKFNADLDPDSVQITDFEIRLNDQSQLPIAATVGGPGFSDRVFLTLFSDLATDVTPKITIVDTISSIGAGQITAGGVFAQDVMAPIITVVLSGGSSTSLPSTLTNDKITITITSTETLSKNPTVEIFSEGATNSAEGTVATQDEGNNTWIATFSGAEFDGSTPGGKKKSIRVIADDAATISAVDSLIDGDTAIPTGIVIGQTVLGSNDASDSEIFFVLDKTAPAFTMSPSGQISDANPTVEWDFGEKVSITDLSFGLPGSPSDFTNLVVSFDQIVYFFPMAGLGPGTYISIVSATDFAGNEAVGLSGGFTVN